MGNYQGDHGDECFCTSCVREALPQVGVFSETVIELRTASTFEEHMHRDIIWLDNPEFDSAFDELLAQHQNRSLPVMDFSDAIRAVKAGHKVTREGWNGAGMFIFLVPGSRFQVNRPPLNTFYPEGTEVEYHGHIDMKTAQGYIVPWIASQADMLADDWIYADSLDLTPFDARAHMLPEDIAELDREIGESEARS